MREALLRHLGSIVFYTVLILVLTLPAPLTMATKVIGTGGDAWQAMWRFEDRWAAAQDAHQQGQVLAFIREEFLGGGPPRLINLSVWPWMPLHVLFGQPLAYNLVWLGSFILSGYAMYGLVITLLRRYSAVPTFQQQAAALVAGVMYMLLPYHVAQAQGHFGAMQIQWLPVVLLAGLAFYRQPSIIRLLTLVVMVIVQAWTEHHYIVWLAGCLLIATAMYWRPMLEQIKRAKSRWAILGLVVLGGLVTSYWPTIRQATVAKSTLALGVDQTIRFSADLFSFVVPASFHPWWGDFFYTLYAHAFTGNGIEATQFLGFIPLLLVIFFYRRISISHKKYWVILLAVFAVMSLGPRLHILGYVSPIPLPYALLQSLPVLSAIRAVSRAGVIVGFALSVLLGLTLATNVRRAVSFIVAGVLIIAEFLFFPVATQSAQVSSAYATLSHVPGSAIVEIPAATNYDLASRALYASRQHNKTIIGNIALERGSTQPDISRSLPAVRQLLYVRTTDLKENRQEFFGQNLAETLVDVATWQDIAAIVIHPDSLSAFQVTILRNFLDNEVGLTGQFYDDILVYPLNQSGRASDGFVAMRGEGWENVGLDRRRGSSFAEIPRRARLTLINTTATAQTRQLRFIIPPESHTGITLEYNGVPLSLSLDDRTVQIPVMVEPGVSQLDFINGLPDKAIIQNPTI